MGLPSALKRGGTAALLVALMLGALTLGAPLAMAQAPAQTQAPAPTQAPSSPPAPAATQAPAQMQAPAPQAQPAPPAPHAAGAHTAAPVAGAPATDVAPLPEALPPALPGVLPHDLSPWGMFMAADVVVKAVMIGLAFASVVTWTIWLVKTLELVAANRAVRSTLGMLRKAPSLAAAAKAVQGRAGGAAGAVVRSAFSEMESSRALPADGIKERAAIALNRVEAHAARRMVLGTGLLATIGSTAPFVGLFGTVWGIMNSFIGISKAHTTNLAVVAPGIAEALLATAIGLVAAIPAVIIYNVFSRAIANYKASLADASAEVMRHLSRDLDREAAGGKHMRTAAE
ncbi:MAG: tonB-system energizer ExbB [Pseudomonadota bacterium]